MLAELVPQLEHQVLLPQLAELIMADDDGELLVEIG
jgi:hypothetical protein